MGKKKKNDSGLQLKIILSILGIICLILDIIDRILRIVKG